VWPQFDCGLTGRTLFLVTRSGAHVRRRPFAALRCAVLTRRPRVAKPIRRRPLAFELLEAREVPAVSQWYVNTTADTPDANPNDLVPADAAGRVSLRAAVQQANFNNTRQPGDLYEIRFTTGAPPPPGQPPQPPPPGETMRITLTLGKMDTFTASISVIGPAGPGSLTIVGTGGAGMFAVAAESTSSFGSLTLRDGTNGAGVGSGQGGGLDNRGRLSLLSVIVDNCTAGRGGGVYSDGPLSMSGCTVRNNRTNAAGQGGGILLEGSPTVDIQHSSIIDNTAVSRGGGIAILNTVRLTIAGGELRRNTAQWGGGIYNSGATLSMWGNGVMAENRATAGRGGGLYQSSGSASLLNVTFSNNTAATWGGAISIVGGTLSLNTCSFYGNGAPNGPVVSYKGDPPTVINCINLAPGDVVLDTD
jgi:predicted outer membrane repeat protein